MRRLFLSQRWMVVSLCVALFACRPSRADTDLLGNMEQATIARAVAWLEGELSESPPEAAARLAWHVSRLSERGLAASAVPLEEATSSSHHQVIVKGKAVDVASFPLSARQREFLELDRIYAVTVEPAERSESVRVLCSEVPPQWVAADMLSEPTRCYAIVLERQPALVVAARMEWYPAAEPMSPLADAHEILLSQAGFDVARLPQIAARSTEGLEEEPADAFYGLFGALQRIPQAAFGKVAATITPTDLLAGVYQGKASFVRTLVETRRVMRIAVTDPHARELLGQDHYWQIDAFGDLGNTKVQLETGTAGEPSIVFENRYPVSVVTTALPASLQEAGRGSATVVMRNQPIEVLGVNYRLWSYRSDFVSGQGGSRQIAPLVMAHSIRDAAIGGVSESSLDQFTLVIAALFLFVLVAIIGALLWVGRRDKAARDRIRRTESPPDLGQI